MSVDRADVQPTGWLFTRDNESVRMTVEDQPSGAALVVRGPGTASATYQFPTMDALMEFAKGQEQQLQRDGFHLQAIAERRVGSDRRAEPRTDISERRRRDR